MVKVYYSIIKNISFNRGNYIFQCEKRNAYVNSITDVKRKNQSAFAWRLLEYATKNYKNVDFDLLDDGRWVDNNQSVKFSLSHSDNVVVVAISDDDIGVDVEKCTDKILKIKYKLISNDSNSINDIVELTSLWAKKESEFKRGKDGAYSTLVIFNDANDKFIISCCAVNGNAVFEQIDYSTLNY